MTVLALIAALTTVGVLSNLAATRTRRRYQPVVVPARYAESMRRHPSQWDAR